MATETVKVLSYNVFMRDLADNPGLKKFLAGAIKAFTFGIVDLNVHLEFFNEQRAELIGNIIAPGDYDVIVFQEAFDDKARRKLIDIIGRAGRFKFSTTIVGLDDSFTSSDGGIFIMSRWPIVRQGQIVYRNAESDDRLAKKGVSWALINKEGFYFNVFGTHTQANGGGVSYHGVRGRQFAEFRRMVSIVGLYWQPALFVGDLNVDFANTQEVNVMLNTLHAAVPQDRLKHTPTSDPANELISDTQQATTLDYVLYADDPQPKPFRPKPLRSSLETIKFRTPYTIRSQPRPWDSPTETNLNDLSDHYAVLGTYTYEKKREDGLLFTGTWKSVVFNRQPDKRDWHITFQPYGTSVESIIDGKVFMAKIEYLATGVEFKGTVRFWNETTKKHEEYYYSFGENDSFKKYFQQGTTVAERINRKYNELTLRTGDRTTLFAFESWLPVERERPPRFS